MLYVDKIYTGIILDDAEKAYTDAYSNKALSAFGHHATAMEAARNSIRIQVIKIYGKTSVHVTSHASKRVVMLSVHEMLCAEARGMLISALLTCLHSRVFNYEAGVSDARLAASVKHYRDCIGLGA